MQKEKSKDLQIFEGSLVNTNVGEIIRALHLHKQTGVLSLRSQKDSRSIYLRQGELIYATTSKHSEKLVTYLEEDNVIDAKQREEIKHIASMGYPVESIVVSKDIMTVRDLIPYVEKCVTNIAAHMYRQNIGDYRFIMSMHPKHGTIAVRIPIAAPAIAGLYQIDDLELITRWLGSTAAIPTLTTNTKRFEGLTLGGVEGFVLSRVDGLTSFRQLAAMSTLNKTKAFALLYASYLASLIDLQEDDMLMRDYSFDLDAALESNFKRIPAKILDRDNFDINWDDVSEDDSVAFYIDGKLQDTDDMMDSKLRIADIKELGIDESGRPKFIPLNAYGLEIKYKYWKQRIYDKEKKQRDIALQGPEVQQRVFDGTESSAYRSRAGVSGQAKVSELVEIQRLKGRVLKFYQRMFTLTYYEILDVSTSSNAREIQKSYDSLKAKFNLEGKPKKALGSTANQYEEVIKRIDEAYQVLSDPKKRREYEDRVASEVRKQEINKQRKIEFAERNFDMGQKELERKDTPRALEYFRAAISLNSNNPSYYEKLALTLASNKLWIDEAQKNLKQAIKLDPENPHFHFVLGKICQEAGLLNAAIRSFRRTIKLDPSNKELHEQVKKHFQPVLQAIKGTQKQKTKR